MKWMIPSVLILTLLTSCGGKTVTKLEPVIDGEGIEVPADLRTCFDGTVSFPKTKSLTKKQAFVLIGRLHAAELDKNNCGHRLLKWIDTLIGVPKKEKEAAKGLIYEAWKRK